MRCRAENVLLYGTSSGLNSCVYRIFNITYESVWPFSTRKHQQHGNQYLHVCRNTNSVSVKCGSVGVAGPTWRRVLTTHNGLVAKIVAAPAPPAASTLDPSDILWWIVCPPFAVWSSGSQSISIRTLGLTTSKHKHLNQEHRALQPPILILYSVLCW